MDDMVATGKEMLVEVTGPAPGEFKSKRNRHVYAILNAGGEIRVAVADDTGKLQWVGPGSYKVVSG